MRIYIFCILLHLLTFYQDDMSIDKSNGPQIDSSLLCPFCDTPLPPKPSLTLLNLIATTSRKAYPDPRPINPGGLTASLNVFVPLCQLHEFERLQIPLAKERGWPGPGDIAWEEVQGRIKAMKTALQDVIAKGMDSNGSSRFWKEIGEEIKRVGSRAAVGVSGQFANFDRCQPG